MVLFAADWSHKHNTWEPADNILDARLIETFEEKDKSKSPRTPRPVVNESKPKTATKPTPSFTSTPSRRRSLRAGLRGTPGNEMTATNEPEPQPESETAQLPTTKRRRSAKKTEENEKSFIEKAVVSEKIAEKSALKKDFKSETAAFEEKKEKGQPKVEEKEKVESKKEEKKKKKEIKAETLKKVTEKKSAKEPVKEAAPEDSTETKKPEEELVKQKDSPATSESKESTEKEEIESSTENGSIEETTEEITKVSEPTEEVDKSIEEEQTENEENESDAVEPPTEKVKESVETIPSNDESKSNGDSNESLKKDANEELGDEKMDTSLSVTNGSFAEEVNGKKSDQAVKRKNVDAEESKPEELPVKQVKLVEKADDKTEESVKNGTETSSNGMAPVVLADA